MANFENVSEIKNGKTLGIACLSCVIRKLELTEPSHDGIVSACVLAIKVTSSGIAEYCRALDNFNTCLYENQPNAEQCEKFAGPIIDTIIMKEATTMNPQSQCRVKATTDNVDYTQLQRLQAFHCAIDHKQTMCVKVNNNLRAQCEKQTNLQRRSTLC